MVLDEIPQEYSFVGRGDFRTPSIIVQRQDGGVMSELKYLSYSVSREAVKLNGLPCSRKGETLTVILKDVCSDIAVRLNYVVEDGTDVLVRNAEIVNEGKEKVEEGLEKGREEGISAQAVALLSAM